MPTKNSIKPFIEDGYYHVYNRGVNKNNIFLDHKDYYNFLWLMKEYLQGDHPTPGYPNRITHGVGDQINLLCYCLMPNHFHLLIKQHSLDGMTKFIRGVCSKYATYFNHRYNRVGTIFQGKYKAANINNDAYLTQISAYIHRNPLDLGKTIDEYPYSSYLNYVGKRNNPLLNTEEIMSLFTTKKLNNSPQKNYENYVKLVELSNNKNFQGMTIDSDQGPTLLRRVGP